MSGQMSELLRRALAGGVTVENPDYRGRLEVDNPGFTASLAPADTLGPERRRLLGEIHALLLNHGDRQKTHRFLVLMERWAEVAGIGMLREPSLRGQALEDAHRVANGLWLGVAHAREVVENIEQLVDLSRFEKEQKEKP